MSVRHIACAELLVCAHAYMYILCMWDTDHVNIMVMHEYIIMVYICMFAFASANKIIVVKIILDFFFKVCCFDIIY